MRTGMLLLSCLLLSAAPGVQPPGEAEEKFITGVDVARLIQDVLGDEISLSRVRAQRRGVRFSLVKDGKHYGSIELGVFADRKAALAVFEDHLVCTSVGPTKNPFGRGIGDKSAAWTGRTGQPKRIVFVRANVAVSLSLPQEELLEVSKSIDRALAQGEGGVELGSELRMPRIVKVEIPEKILAGSDVPVTVHVAVPARIVGDALGFAGRSGVAQGGLPILDAEGQAETIVVRTARYYAPRSADGAKPVECWLCYATRGCLMATKKIIIPPPVAKPSD